MSRRIVEFARLKIATSRSKLSANAEPLQGGGHTDQSLILIAFVVRSAAELIVENVKRSSPRRQL